MVAKKDLKGLRDLEIVMAFAREQGKTFAQVCDVAVGRAYPEKWFRLQYDMPLDFSRALGLEGREQRLFFEAVGYTLVHPQYSLEDIAEGKTPAKTVPALIKEIRYAASYSPRQFAETMGVSSTYVEKTENGKLDRTSPSYNQKIGKKFGGTPEVADGLTQRLNTLGGHIKEKKPLKDIFDDPKNKDFSALHRAVRTEHLQLSCKELAVRIKRKTGVSLSDGLITAIELGNHMPTPANMETVANGFAFPPSFRKQFMERAEQKRAALKSAPADCYKELVALLEQDMEKRALSSAGLSRISGVSATLINYILGGRYENDVTAETISNLTDSMEISGERREQYFTAANAVEQPSRTVKEVFAGVTKETRLGDLMLSLRNARGMARLRLEELSGVNEHTIMHIEQNKPARPTVRTLASLADGLDLDQRQFGVVLDIAGYSRCAANMVLFEKRTSIRTTLNGYQDGRTPLNHAVKFVMMERNMSLETLATASGVSNAALNGLMTRDIRPSDDDIKKIGEALNLDPEREMGLLLRARSTSQGFVGRTSRQTNGTARQPG